MIWNKHRGTIANVGYVLFVADLLLYWSAILRTSHIDPTSAEFFIYFIGGIIINVVALILGCFGIGWKRTVVLLSSIALFYLWISYIGLEIMKH